MRRMGWKMGGKIVVGFVRERKRWKQINDLAESFPETPQDVGCLRFLTISEHESWPRTFRA